MEFQQPLTTTEEDDDDENNSNDDSEVGPPASDELRTYIIIVNDDGSLSLDPNGIVAEDADPQSVIPVHLPINKMKSADCPLPGATPFPGTSRARKTKPQATLYGGDIEDQEPAVTSTGVSGASAPIDIAQLGPQDIAILENILQSEQAREMREFQENMAFPAEDIPTTNSNVISHHLWDHSYSTLSAPSPQVQALPPAATQSASTLGPLVDHMSMAKNIEELRTSTPAKSTIKVSFNQNNKVSNNPPAVNPPATARLASSPVPVNSPTPRRGSEVDDLLSAGESNAIKRRSQRQQDRIERLEAERIMAENQQMLQREKELMMENSNVVAKQRDASPSTPAVPAVARVDSSSPLPVVESARVASPILTNPKALMPSPSSSIDETPKSDKFKRPARQRKLPAHLADPNYLHLDEDARNLPSKTLSPPEPEPVPVQEDEVEEPEKEDAESEEEEADGEVEEDDPNKLWCICRKPHNNRFMICCDKCDDWFHGKCVGVTKAQATQMEENKKLWHCPTCRKIIKQQTPAPKTPKTPGRTSSRRGSETSQSSTTSSVETKEKPETKKLTAAGAIKAKVSLALEAPKRRVSAASGVVKAKPAGRRKSDSLSQQTEASGDGKIPQCIVCGVRARADSVYCSEDCVRQHATTTIANSTAAASKPKDTVATPVTPTTPSPSSQKLKRLSSIKDQEKHKEPEQPFFAFHVIQPGAAKSTEVVPPRQKEQVAGPHVKPSVVQPSNSVATTSPPAADKTSSSSGAVSKPALTPAKSAPSQGQSQGQNSKNVVSSSTGNNPTSKKNASSSKDVKESPSKDKAATKTSRSSSEKNGGKEKRKVKESAKDLDKERDARHGRDGEALMKENFKKTLRETFKDRLKNVPSEEKTSYPATNTPENMADKIVEELAQYYGSANNVKGKAKYRSIIFNLRDAKNSLFREILQGNITAKTLVKMEATEMASAELSEWRNRENQKNLEMIKKAELDKLVEAKKQELIDKGADVDVAVEEQAKQNLDIADVIQLKDKDLEEKEVGGDNEKGSSSKSSHRKDKKKDKRKEKDLDKEKQRDSKDHYATSSKDKDGKDKQDKDRRSDRHRHRSSRDEVKPKESPKEKESSKDKNYKDKDKSKPSNGINSNSNNGKDKDVRKDRDKNSSTVKIKSEKDTNSKIKHPDSVEKMEEDAHSHATSHKESFTSKSKIEDSSLPGVRHSTDSEQELPSSTIKTPDFTDEPKKENVQTSIFRTKLIMHELGHFQAVAYHVSHNSLEGTIFPESPVPIVGRISPDTVWDYIDKMKKTKEVIVLRLAPESDADSQGYQTFFSYLSSRGRLGVMGGLSPPLKDVYLIPLNKHSPINRALLPFRGPGLPKERNHCLLAVVTRHIIDVPPAIQPKRKASIQSAETSSVTTKKKRTTEAGPSESPTSSTTAVVRQLSKGSPNALPSRSLSGIPGLSVESVNTGPLADPRRKAEPQIEEPLPNDDDQPYTPWEDEDDKDVDVKPEASAVPVISVPDDKATAQMLLEDLNRKIQMEKQEIASIAVAIKRNENITHIPGLDGDFPKEDSPVSVLKEKIPDEIPFFLRSQPIQSKLPLPIMTEPDSEQLLIPAISEPKPSMLSSTENKSSSKDTDCIILSDEDSVLKPVNLKPEMLKESVSEVVELEDEDEAYSPSAMDFSDEEEEKNKKDDEEVVIVNDPRTIPPPKVCPATTPANVSPFVDLGCNQGKEEIMPEVVALEEEGPLGGNSVQVKIPGLDFTDSFEKVSSLGLERSSSVTKSKPDFINLDVDELEEPPPPGESIPSPIFRTPTKPALDSVFSLGPLPTISPKVKIQINLAPKSTSCGTTNPSILSAVSSTKSSTTSTFSPTPVAAPSAPGTLDIPLPPSEPPQTTASLPPALSIALAPNVSIPPPGLASIPIPPIPTNIPPPHFNVMSPTLPVTSIPLIPPPPVSFPVQINADTSSGFPRTPALIPAPPVGGVSFNTSIPPPGPIAGMVPVSAIPPLPTLRGMPSLTPLRFPTNISMTNIQPKQPQPQLNRFRPMGGRYPVPSSTGSFPTKASPPEPPILRQAPPLLSPVPSPSSSSGSSSAFERKRNNSFSDKNDGSDSKFSSNYQKGSDRYRNSRSSYGNRHRSRSRSGSRSRSTGINRSRSRSRDRNRDRPERRHRRRHSRSRSRSPGPSGSSRRISRTRSPSLSSNRKSPTRRHNSKSRSPSSGRNRRSRRSRSSSPVTSSSSGKI